MERHSIEKEFIKSLKSGFSNYTKFGARSNKKLIPIHSWIGSTIKNMLGEPYCVKCLGLGDGKEDSVEGKYHKKKVDILISKNDKNICVCSFKFVTSNYMQNSINYFENLLGETANIRRKNIGFAHLLVLRGHTPYYNKNSGNKRGKMIKKEILNNHHIEKYVKLFEDQDFPHKPDVLGLSIIDINEKSKKVEYFNVDTLDFDEKTKIMLEEEFSIKKFFNRLFHYCKYNS